MDHFAEYLNIVKNVELSPQFSSNFIVFKGLTQLYVAPLRNFHTVTIDGIMEIAI